MVDYCQNLLMKRITQIIDKEVRTSYYKDIGNMYVQVLESVDTYVRIS